MLWCTMQLEQGMCLRVGIILSTDKCRDNSMAGMLARRLFAPFLRKSTNNPADTWRNNDVIITSKRRRNVIWRYCYVMCPLGIQPHCSLNNMDKFCYTCTKFLNAFSWKHCVFQFHVFLSVQCLSRTCQWHKLLGCTMGWLQSLMPTSLGYPQRRCPGKSWHAHSSNSRRFHVCALNGPHPWQPPVGHTRNWYDDVMPWKWWCFVRRRHRLPMDSYHKRLEMRSCDLMFSLFLAWTGC